jgi:coenzyme F420 hydrogenase subunit beta
MVDVPAEALRPVVGKGHPTECECLKGCPVVECVFSRNGAQRDPFELEWGPILELGEGYATDEEIRFQGASGGVLTALGAFCIERLGMEGALHIGPDETDPTRNRVYLSRSRPELLARAGSRYAPAALCERLELVEKASAPCVVIGRPVEIAAVAKLRKLRPGLDAKIGLTLSFFCAESPARLGTIKLLERAGLDPLQVAEIRYRGRGWPGEFQVRLKGATEPVVK